MTMPGAPVHTHGYGSPPPARAPRDSTRTIAVIALVLAVVSLVVPIGLTLVPLALFGLFGGGIGDPDEDLFLGSGHAEDLRVPGGGGAVPGPALAAVLRDAGPFGGEPLTCPDVDRAVRDATALCEVDTDPRTYVVVRFTDDDGDLVADWFAPGDPFGPGF